MDLTNKLTLGAIATLSLIIVAMLAQNYILQSHNSSAVNRQEAFVKQYELKIAKNNKIYKDVTSMIEQKKFPEAMDHLGKIMQENPDNPQSLIYKAQIEIGLGKLAEPIHTYRQAINAEPDYIDKKTPLFIGHSIMTLITEARAKLSREIKLKPGEQLIAIALDDIYYLQRRIAGGCE